MASDTTARWWRPALECSPDAALGLEAAAGQQQRFADLDAMVGRLLSLALSGQPLVTVTPGSAQSSDSVEVAVLTAQERAWCGEAFDVREQQRRGAWFVPQKMSLKAGAVNLPSLLRARPAYAVTLAGDDTARLHAVEGADAVLLWALLMPLFETVLEPVRVRAAGPTGTREEQRQLWSAVESRYRSLGIGSGALEAFRFGGDWHLLDRAGQQQARLRLLDALASVDPVQLAGRHRMLMLQGLMSAFAKKAKTGSALARRVLTRALQPVVSGYFAGDWLAVLDYLHAAPHPDEEVITALPEPRLYVGMSSQAADMAAEAGIPESELHAMLAAFMGSGTSLSPVEERSAALRDWWAAFDEAHALQKPGMAPLWGLVDQDLMSVSRTVQGFTPQLYARLLPAEILEKVSRLWETVALPRHPGSIVSNPRPHLTMAEALGPAAEFWHGVGLTAWFCCEGPMSRTTLSGIERYYQQPLAALQAAGCPVDPALFEELHAAEQQLGPEEEITDSRDSTLETDYGTLTFTASMGRGIRRDGFEQVRDLITRHRRQWAQEHLGAYVKRRWRRELEDVAHQHHRHVAAKGRPPTLIQFARFATQAANHWTGGDLGALYTAIGEPAPSQQARLARLLQGDGGYDFARRVYQELGGEPVVQDSLAHKPEEARRQWQLDRLATESLRYLQLQEALGQPPTAKQFGAHRLAWPWPGEEDEGWPILQRVLATLTGGAAVPGHSPAVAVPEDSVRTLNSPSLAKGANAFLGTEATTVELTTTGAPVDVSAVLLSCDGKVRSDNDLVFYNHPSHDGVAVGGSAVTADLEQVPGDVTTIAVVASIDLEAQPAAVFDQRTTWRAYIAQPSGTQLSFSPAPFTSGETVVVTVELYRYAGGWKARAVGQGYDTGLAGLATDYGIDVEE
ncbi:TerD family protein [Streptomyces yangpuensis]|uniref:TerD family protein n=1 Tax=Streptomyces yangpuensis TaxID=1648182 RepID=UPI00364AA9ED